MLARRLAELGHYPAVDILASVSRLMNSVVSKEHLLAAQKFKAIYATYQGAEDLINIGALSQGSNRRIDKAVSLIDRVNEFLIQPIGQRSSFTKTLDWLYDITKSWDFLLPSEEDSKSTSAGPGERQARGSATPAEKPAGGSARGRKLSNEVRK